MITKRILVLLFVLIALLWIGLGMRKENPLPQGGKRLGGGAGGDVKIRKVTLAPHDPNLQSILRVNIETDPPSYFTGQANPYQYRWFVNQKEVSRESFLSLSKFRQGDMVLVEVTSDGLQSSMASAKLVIGNRVPMIQSIRLSPKSIFAGGSLQATVDAKDPDGDTVYLSYEWQINGKVVLGHDKDSLSGDQIHSADKIVVSVTPSDLMSKGSVADSPLMTVINRSPTILSTPPSHQENGKYTYQLIAKDPDGDSLQYLLVTGPSGMRVNPIAGLLEWEVSDNKTDVAVEVNDAKGGAVTQKFTIQFAK